MPKKNEKMNYKITKNSPVARFWYKGTHSHPVKRTVLVIESDRYVLTGYEIREGAEIRKLANPQLKVIVGTELPEAEIYGSKVIREKSIQQNQL